MANKVTIEITVDDKGTATIKRFGADAKESLQKISQSAGETSGVMGKLKQSWTDLTGAAGVLMAAFMTFYAVKNAFDFISAPFIEGFRAVETYSQSIASLAAFVVTFTERQKGMSLGDQWQEALEYSSAMVPILENLAAKTLLSGQETTALANAFARTGVFLDASNVKQIESFTRISNALPLMTKGQDIMRQINTEIRSVMTGQNEQVSMMLQTLKAIDPQIEEHLKTWRKEGTVLEKIGDLLVGFGPATALLEKQWMAVKTTITTTYMQALRGGMRAAYKEIIELVQYIERALREQKDTIAVGMTVAWSMVANIIQAVWGVLSGFGPMLKDVGGLVGMIAYGWGGVFAVLKPIGAFLGNSIALTYELLKMIGNAVVAAGALATGNLAVAKTAWDEAKKNFKEVEILSQKNRDILTDGIADSIVKYGMQTEAATSGFGKISDASKVLKTNTIADNAEATKERKKTIADITEAIRKATYEAETIGQTQYEKDVARIESDAAKNKEALGGKAISAKDLLLVQQYVAVEMEAANKNAYEEMAKDARKASDVAIDEMERQIAQGVKLSEEHIKGTEQYEILVAEAADFATTENERAINKIIADEQIKFKEIEMLYDTGVISFSQYVDLMTQYALKSDAARLEKETENAKKIADLNYNLIKDIQGYEEIAYNMRIKQIEAQAEVYRKDGAGQAEIARWVAEESIKAYIEMGKKSGDFFTGVTAGFLEMQRSQKTWGEVGYGMITTFAKDSIKQLDDNLFLLLKGRWGEMAIDFESIMDDMLRILTAKIAEMIVQWALYEAAVYAAQGAQALGFNVPAAFGLTAPGGGLGNLTTAAGLGKLGYSALAGGTTAAGAAGLGGGGGVFAGAAGATPFVVDMSLAGGTTAAGLTTSGAGMAVAPSGFGGGAGVLSTIGTAVIPIAAVAAAGMFIENVLRPLTKINPTANQYTPEAWATQSLYHYMGSPANFGDFVSGRFTPAKQRDIWKAKYDGWYREMAYYFGQNIPMTISADQAWLQSAPYKGGGYPAQRGLDYVPYDNFLIRAHEGERVQTKEEADKWRGSGGRGGVIVNGPLIRIDGNLIAGEKEFNAFVKKIGQRLDRFAARRIDARVS